MNKKKKITIWIILLVIAIVTMLGGLIFLILNIKDDDSTKVYNDDNKYNIEPYDFDYYHIRDIGNDTVSLGNHGKMVIKHFDDGEEYHFYDKNNNELKVTGDNLGVHYRFYGYDRIRMHLIAYYLKNNEYYKDEFLIYSDHVEVKSIKNDMQKMYYVNKVNLKDNDVTLNIDDKTVSLSYDNKDGRISINGNNSSYTDIDSTIFYTNNLIITRYSQYGAYSYDFYNSNGEMINYYNYSSVRNKSYYYKDLSVKDKKLYTTSICILKECYAKKTFNPVNLEINYNGQDVYMIDAK